MEEFIIIMAVLIVLKLVDSVIVLALKHAVQRATQNEVQKILSIQKVEQQMASATTVEPTILQQPVVEKKEKKIAKVLFAILKIFLIILLVGFTYETFFN